MTFSLSPDVSVLVGETERVRTRSSDDGQSAGVGDDIPRESQSHILVAFQTVTIIPKVIVGVHVLEVQIGVLTAANDLVPKNDLNKRKNLMWEFCGNEDNIFYLV